MFLFLSGMVAGIVLTVALGALFIGYAWISSDTAAGVRIMDRTPHKNPK